MGVSTENFLNHEVFLPSFYHGSSCWFLLPNFTWAGDLSCCFTRDFSNSKCMWDKPKELYGDTRQGYEISAWNSWKMTAKGALEGWRGSPPHVDVILTKRNWGFLTDFGCWWKGNFAH